MFIISKMAKRIAPTLLGPPIQASTLFNLPQKLPDIGKDELYAQNSEYNRILALIRSFPELHRKIEYVYKEAGKLKAGEHAIMEWADVIVDLPRVENEYKAAMKHITLFLKKTGKKYDNDKNLTLSGDMLNSIEDMLYELNTIVKERMNENQSIKKKKSTKVAAVSAVGGGLKKVAVELPRRYTKKRLCDGNKKDLHFVLFLSQLTLPDLKIVASEHGVTVPAKSKKSDILEKIVEKFATRKKSKSRKQK